MFNIEECIFPMTKNRMMFRAIRMVQVTYCITFIEARTLFWSWSEDARNTWMKP
jgi:hypothetical protein